MRTRNAVSTRIRRRSVAMAAAGGLVASGLVAVTAAQAEPVGPYFIDSGADRDAMLDTTPAPTLLPDPEGNAKELGPVNGSDTKLVVIHEAAVPMLKETNPNAQVDLRDIWLGTSTQSGGPDDGDQFLYFAWERDAANGSGVLAIEFQVAPLGAECDYDGGAFDPDLCNPWSGRQAGDFLLVWDQQGQDIEIIKRTFFDDGGALALDAGAPLTSATAAVSADGFFGEAAINLTDDVFGTAVDSCTTLANVIPGTVTGNSDTADYKDTVLAEAPPISNCGSVTISKVTDPVENPATTSFTWTLDRADGSPINYDPDTSATDTIKHGETDTETDLIAGTNYNLAETNPGPAYAIKSIVCTDAGGSTYNAKDGNFPVNAGETTACVITNELQPGTLTVNKVLDYNWGGDAAVTAFKFDVAGPTASSNNTFEADGSNDLQVVAGTYNVTETTIPTGYKEKSNTCTNVVVPAGGSASCTITNEDIPGTLVVKKIVKNDFGQTSTAGDFTFKVNGGDDESFTEDPSDDSKGEWEENVSAGTYSVVENTPPAGYTPSYSDDYEPPAGDPAQADECLLMEIGLGETVTCTITNQDSANAPDPPSTVQSWVLHDSATVAIRPGATNAADADMKFELFTDQLCTVPVQVDDGADGLEDYQEVIDVTVSANGEEVSAATVAGAAVDASGEYYWKVTYSGDDYNQGSASECTQEITEILAKDDLPRDDFNPTP